MADLPMRFACWDYDRTRALMDGSVKPEGIALKYENLFPAVTFQRIHSAVEALGIAELQWFVPVEIYRGGNSHPSTSSGEAASKPGLGGAPGKYSMLLHAFTEDTWVQNAQIISDNPASLHHCNMGFANLIEGFKEDNFITGTVPGGEPMNLDDGIAFCIPKGSVLGLQIHFVSTGKPEKCRLSAGKTPNLM